MENNISNYAVSDSLLDSLNKPVLYKLIENFMITCSIYPTLMYASFLNNAKCITPSIMLKGALILIPAILLPLLRYLSKNIFIYILGSIALAAGAFCLGLELFNKIIFAAFIVVLAVKDIIISQKYRKINFLIGLSAWTFISMSILYKYKLMVSASLLCSFIVFVTYIFYMFFSRQKIVKTLSKSGNSFPREKINKIRQKLSIIIGTITLILWMISLEVGRILNEAINKFLSGKHKTVIPKAHYIAQKSQPQRKNDPLKFLMPKTKSHSDNRLLFMLGYVIIAALFIYLLINLAIYIKNNFKGYKKDDSEEESESIFSFEDIQSQMRNRFKNAINNLKSKVNASNRKEIRNTYKKVIKGYMKKDIEISQGNTPGEINDTIKNKRQEDVSKLTLIYEKARYDKAEPTDEEVRIVKELAKKPK